MKKDAEIKVCEDTDDVEFAKEHGFDVKRFERNYQKIIEENESKESKEKIVYSLQDE